MDGARVSFMCSGACDAMEWRVDESAVGGRVHRFESAGRFSSFF